MKLCPQCDKGYPGSESTCPIHGGPLTETGDLPAGLLIGGAYRIQHKLGQGNLGSVYLVEQLDGGELKTLKFISPEFSGDESFTSRFMRAARRLSELHHPNVLATGDLQCAEDGSLFFPMEFVDGPSLRILLNMAPRPFDPGLALAITRCLAEGLEAAHAAGLIHLDLKPENILIAPDADSMLPKIANFGIGATRENGSTFLAAGRILLTPTYAAPEQWLNTRLELLDGRADLYALGGVLFEMLTRETVFGAIGYHAWARQHLTAPPRKPSELLPELAGWRGLDDLLLTLLAKEPNDRPRDAAALLELLDDVQFGIRPVPIPQVPFVADNSPVAPEPEVPAADESAGTPESEPEVPADGEFEGTPESEPETEAGNPIASAPDEVYENPSVSTDSLSPALPVEPTDVEPEDQPAASEPPPAVAAEFSAPDPVEENIPAPEPEISYTPEVTALEPEINPDEPDPTPVAAAEPPPPEPAAVEPPLLEPVYPATFSPPQPAEEPFSIPEPRLFTPSFRPADTEFRPTEPDFLHSAAPIGLTPAVPEDEEPAEPTMDVEEFQRLFGRRDTGVRFEEPRQRTMSASSFFDPPATGPGIDEPPSRNAETTDLFARRSAPPGAEAPPTPVPELPAAFTPPATFPGAVETPRPTREVPFRQAEPATTVDWIETGRTADPATLRAAIATVSPFPGATSVPAYIFPPQAFREDREPDRHPHRVVVIVVAAILVLAAAGFAIWRFGFDNANQPVARMSSACTSGDSKACYDLAAWNEQSNKDSDGNARAAIFYAKACDLSFPLACRKLALKYAFGAGIALDTPKAIEFFAKGCDKADMESCYHLANIYHEGKGVPMDDAKAVAIYNKACAAGDDSGCMWAKRLATPAKPPKPAPRRVTPADADSDKTQ